MNPRASMPSTRSILLLDVVRGQRVDQLGEAGLVLEQRGDVVKENSGLGKIGHGAHQRLQGLHIQWA